MAISFEKLVHFLRTAEVRYFLVPDQPAVAIGSLTDNGRHFLLHVVIEADGSLIQLRTTGYGHCPMSSPHYIAVLTLLNELNWRLRIVKFTLDPTDGEIIVYADMAIIDSDPTQSQVMGLISFVMERLRECAERIEVTARTGVDPGEEDFIGDDLSDEDDILDDELDDEIDELDDEPPGDEPPGDTEPDDVIS